MKWLLLILVLLLAGLQYRLWVGEGSLAHIDALESAIAEQSAENARLRQRNDALARDVAELAREGDAIEEVARSELGLIRDGETFYMIVETPPADAPPAPSVTEP